MTVPPSALSGCCVGGAVLLFFFGAILSEEGVEGRGAQRDNNVGPQQLVQNSCQVARKGKNDCEAEGVVR